MPPTRISLASLSSLLLPFSRRGLLRFAAPSHFHPCATVTVTVARSSHLPHVHLESHFVPTMTRRSARIRALHSRSPGSAEPTSMTNPKEESPRQTKKPRAAAPATAPAAIAVPSTSVPQTKQKRTLHKPNSPSRPQNDHDDHDPSLLLDIGPLVKGTVHKRPSASIKSPYVADVLLANKTMALAHCPALDVGGLCAIGSTVYMSTRPPGGKTSHAIELVETTTMTTTHGGGEEEEAVLVGAHPRLGEVLAEEVLRRGLLEQVIGYGPAELGTRRKQSSPKRNKKKTIANAEEKMNHDGDGMGVAERVARLYKQCTYGDSRVDFEVTQTTNASSTHEEIQRTLIEVKNVVCSDYCATNAPEKRNPNHCVIVAAEDESSYRRSAIFPWGRVGQSFEGKKVVSERAIKHLRNLVDMSNKHDNVDAIILFVINRSDCVKMRPCHEACPVFATELSSAAKQNCKVIGFRVRWTLEGRAYFDGIVPVQLYQGNENSG